jgi:hypothetical protein
MLLSYLMTLWLALMVDNLLKRIQGMRYREDVVGALDCRYCPATLKFYMDYYFGIHCTLIFQFLLF